MGVSAVVCEACEGLVKLVVKAPNQALARVCEGCEAFSRDMASRAGANVCAFPLHLFQ